MPDPVIPDPNKPEEPKQPPTMGQEVRSKSFRDLVRESRQESTGTPADDETAQKTKEDEEKKAAEEKAKQEEEAKKTEDADRAKAEQEKQEREDIAKKAADEALAKQRDEENKKVEEEKRQQEDKQREERLKPSWLTDPNAPKDAQGNPLPRSYEEIVAEANRIADERLEAKLAERDRQKSAEEEQKRLDAQKSEEAKKAQREQMEKQIDTEVQNDLQDLYASNKLPKVLNPNDEKDPGIVAQRELFKVGAEINAQRLKEGKPPIRSIKLIFYEHYKAPKTQPAGHDAPVMGNTPPSAPQQDPNAYNWARDHKKSPRQMLAEMKAAALKKAGMGK